MTQMDMMNADKSSTHQRRSAPEAAVSAFHSGLVAQVITLPHRTDRRERFTAMAAEQGLRYEFVDGVVHTDPIIGCNHAHKDQVLRAKAASEPFAFIMEDDAFFVSPGAYAHFLAQWPKDFDLYVGGAYGCGERPDGTLSWFGGTHCYVVHERFYDELLGARMDLHWDRAISALDGRYELCRPWACMQRNGHSDGTGKTENYERWGREKWYKG